MLFYKTKIIASKAGSMVRYARILNQRYKICIRTTINFTTGTV